MVPKARPKGGDVGKEETPEVRSLATATWEEESLGAEAVALSVLMGCRNHHPSRRRFRHQCLLQHCCHFQRRRRFQSRSRFQSRIRCRSLRHFQPRCHCQTLHQRQTRPPHQPHHHFPCHQSRRRGMATVATVAPEKAGKESCCWLRGMPFRCHSRQGYCRCPSRRYQSRRRRHPRFQAQGLMGEESWRTRLRCTA